MRWLRSLRSFRSRSARVAIALLFSMSAMALVGPAALAAADGDLDEGRFYPPWGMVGSAGGGIVADGGLADPDGVAIGLMHAPGGEVHWRQYPEDGNFGVSCEQVIPFTATARPVSALFDGQGRLVVVGNATSPVVDDFIFALRFLYPACTLDPEFGAGGLALVTLADPIAADAVATQTVYVLGLPRERLVIAGTRFVGSTGGFADALVVRLTGAGELDGGFGTGGWTSFGRGTHAEVVVDLAVDFANRIVVAAQVDPFQTPATSALVRLTTAGQIDTSWWSTDGGWRLFDGVVGAVELATDGNYVVAGWTPNGETRSLVIGALHPGTGHMTVRWISTGSDLMAVTSAVAQGDRKLLVAGWGNGFDGDFDPFVVRVFDHPGTAGVDTTFGSGGESDPLTYFSIEGVPGGSDSARAIDLAAGRPVLFGEKNFGDVQGFFVARLENAYIFADGFERGGTSAW